MTIVRLAIAPIFALSLFGAAAPALATDTSHALKLCQHNNSCHSRVGEHSVIMTIDGKDVVECPRVSTGQCIVIRTATGHATDPSAVLVPKQGADASPAPSRFTKPDLATTSLATFEAQTAGGQFAQSDVSAVQQASFN